MPKLETIVDYDLVTWPYVHPSMPKGCITEFYGTDSEQLYTKNLKNLDSMWLYNSTSVAYNFNSHGLRMKKNIEHVEKDFIYFSGTSFTMGIGINEKDRFSELVSNTLSLDMINYAGPTYSTKLQVLSFFNFIKKYKKPKILVIEYPPSVGYTFFENTTAITYYSKHSPTTHYSDIYNSLLNTDFLKNEATIYRNMLQVLCKECNIKLVEVSFNKDDAYMSNDIIIVDQDIINNEEINLRFGRDVFKQNGYYSGHPGVGIHTFVADAILRKLK
jgi:hypothetical protein